jgi:hypothetical protein
VSTFFGRSRSEQDDDAHYLAVRYLDRSEVLVMFSFTNSNIFMTRSGKPVPQLPDEKWVMALAFSVAVTTQELSV